MSNEKGYGRDLYEGFRYCGLLLTGLTSTFMECKVCKKDIIKSMSISSSGHYVYKDSTGRRWEGKTCPDCVNLKDKEVRYKTKSCLYCNKDFIGPGNKKYCSKECFSLNRRRVLKQEIV